MDKKLLTKTVILALLTPIWCITQNSTQYSERICLNINLFMCISKKIVKKGEQNILIYYQFKNNSRKILLKWPFSKTFPVQKKFQNNSRKKMWLRTTAVGPQY